MPGREEYLESAVVHIRDKRKRLEVKEELTAHFDDIIEYHLSRGVSEDEALAKAIDEMGDADTLSYKLGEIHSFFPAKDLKNALTLFILGFLLVSINIDVRYLRPITTGIGGVLLLLALFKLKNCGRLFRISFILYTSAFLLGAAAETVTALPVDYMLGNWQEIITSIFAICSCTAYIIAVSGVAQVVPEKLQGSLAVASWMYGIAVLLCVLFRFAALVLIITVIYIAVRLGEAKQYLWANEWDGGMKKLPKRKSVMLSCLGIIVCAAPFAVSLCVTLLPSSGEPYLRGEETPEVMSIKQGLISAGAEETVFEDMLFEDVLLLDGFEPGIKQTLYTSLENGEEAVYELYPFAKDERCAFVLKYEHETLPKRTRAYQLYFRVRNDNGFYPLEIDTELTPEHAVSLFEKDGETMRAKAYHVADFSDGGMEYKIQRGVKGQRGYIMFTVKGLPENAAEIELYSYDQKLPVRVPYTVKTLSEREAQTKAADPDSFIWSSPLFPWEIYIGEAFK